MRQPALHGAPFERGRRPEVVRPDAAPGRRRKGARPRPAGAAVSGRDAHARPGGPFLARAAKARFAVEKESGNGVTTVRFRYREAERRRARPHLRLPGFVRRRREGRARGRARRPGRARPRARNRQPVRRRSSRAATRSRARRSRSPRRPRSTARPRTVSRSPCPRARASSPRASRTTTSSPRSSRRGPRPSRCGPWRSRRPPRRPDGKPAAAEAESEVVLSAPGARRDGRLPRPEGARRPREDAARHGPPHRLRLVRDRREAAPLGPARRSRRSSETGASRSSSSRSSSRSSSTRSRTSSSSR